MFVFFAGCVVANEARKSEKDAFSRFLHFLSFVRESTFKEEEKKETQMVLLAPSPGRYLLALLVLSVLVVLPLALAVTKLKSAPDRLRRRR